MCPMPHRSFPRPAIRAPRSILPSESSVSGTGHRCAYTHVRLGEAFNIRTVLNGVQERCALRASGTAMSSKRAAASANTQFPKI